MEHTNIIVLYYIQFSHKKHGIKRFCHVLITAMEVAQERFRVPDECFFYITVI